MGLMESYVVFLRGINVGGVKVLMKELAQLLSDGGFHSVRTVLATGNVLLESSLATAAEVQDRCDQLLAEKYGRPLETLVFASSQVLDLASDFPLSADGTEHRYLTLCAEDAEVLGEFLPADNSWQANGPYLYWLAPKGGTTDAPVSKALTKAARRHLVTTRNFNTIEKLAELIRQQ